MKISLAPLVEELDVHVLVVLPVCPDTTLACTLLFTPIPLSMGATLESLPGRISSFHVCLNFGLSLATYCIPITSSNCFAVQVPVHPSSRGLK